MPLCHINTTVLIRILFYLSLVLSLLTPSTCFPFPQRARPFKQTVLLSLKALTPLFHGQGGYQTVSDLLAIYAPGPGSWICRATRIQFQDDEENGRVGREREAYRHDRRLSRQSSVGSLSIHSAGGGSRHIQPETALPITYRTL